MALYARLRAAGIRPTLIQAIFSLRFSVAMLTPLPPQEAKEFLAKALDERLAPKQATPNQLALLWAQSALETGSWKSIHEYNFGNLVAGPNWHGETVTLDDSGNRREFRAYPDPLSGARDYVGQIWRRPEWRAGLLSGSPATYAKALKSLPAYYEASESRYLATLQPLWEHFGGTHRSALAMVATFAALGVAVILAKSRG